MTLPLLAAARARVASWHEALFGARRPPAPSLPPSSRPSLFGIDLDLPAPVDFGPVRLLRTYWRPSRPWHFVVLGSMYVVASLAIVVVVPGDELVHQAYVAALGLALLVAALAVRSVVVASDKGISIATLGARRNLPYAAIDEVVHHTLGLSVILKTGHSVLVVPTFGLGELAIRGIRPLEEALRHGVSEARRQRAEARVQSLVSRSRLKQTRSSAASIALSA